MTYDLQDAQGVSLVPDDRNRLLCPRDYCSIEHVDELVAAGVSALKIEGRMKNPDYVYNVVSTYRAALDACAAGTYDASFARACKRRLGMSFNRGFTDAYLRGASGAELMSSERACNQGMPVGMLVDRGRDEVTVALDADVRAGDMFEIRSTPGPDAPKDVPKRWPQVPCPVDAPAGANILVHCKRKVEVGSAVHRISSVDVLERSRAAVAQMHAELDGFESAATAGPAGCTTPACAAVAAPPARSVAIPAARETVPDALAPEPRLSVLAGDAKTAAALLRDARVERVLVRASTVRENAAGWQDMLPRLTVVLDEPARACDEKTARGLMQKAAGVVCRNYAHLEWARAERATFDVAAPLSVTNGRSADWFAAGCAGCVWLPDELTREEILPLARTARLSGSTRLGVLAFGVPQLMVCEHCLLTAEGSCAAECSTCKRRASVRALVERDGSRLSVQVDALGRTRIFNDEPLDRLPDLPELIEAGVSDFLVDAQLLDEDELACALVSLSKALTASSH